ncbi:general glycosylation pathway protein [Flavobacteriales bacterium ALC-1]|nr:general glycosylation pathway protein [Flavobacteriales bacterium ALC-1]
MQSKHKKRICIVSRSLSEGGADRVAAMQSVLLSDLGYTIFFVTILNSIQYPYKGELLNLGEIKEQNDTFLGRFKRLLILKKFLKANQIDVVIDHRVRSKPFSEYIISGFIYPKQTIYMIHNFAIGLYFPPFKWLTRLFYRRAKRIVCVSQGIKNLVEKTYGFDNLTTLYNPIDFNYINDLKEEQIPEVSPFIFWYGRFEEEQKNLSLLIEAYQKSKLPQKGIKLILMGDGKDKNMIAKKISDSNLKEMVQLLPFSKNPFAYINKSRFTVLSSRFEGFPMTTLESLACGIPIVSVKYKNYEDGIIIDRHNGLLVENHNSNALAKALNNFIEDEKLYLSCRSSAKESVMPFTVSTIAKQWQNLIEAK